MATAVGIRELLESGVHFGHQTRRWNPKMRRFIHGEREGIYIIDLLKTEDSLQKFLASKGWSGGVDASVAVLTVGANGALDANAAQAPTAAFIMTNAGLMAGATLQGTKITRIDN